MVSTAATASMAPLAPSPWPVTPLVEVTGGESAPEHLADGVGLGLVVERGRGAVGVDVADLVGADAGVLHGQLHAGGGAGAARERGR